MSNRIFYASQSIAVATGGAGPGTVVQGATSVSLATNFSLDKMYQLGHISVYDQIVNAPEVEVTVAKNLDGNDTIYKLATGGGSLIATSAGAPTLTLAIGSDTDSQVTAANAASVVMTGCFLKSVKYDMQVEGAFTEECSFVGSSKTVTATAGTAPSTSGAKVLSRRNFTIGANTSLPSEVSGKNLQSVSISADLGREAMYKLGQFTPFFRAVQFPLEITCEIAVMATAHDGVLLTQSEMNGCIPAGVPSGQQITIALCEAVSGVEKYVFNLGNKCNLQSVNYSGGDTGGGNVTITYSYSTANTLTITG